MKPIDVYPIYDIEPVKGEGSWIWDKKGRKYLDLYGGHAVISIGHSHPHYIQRISDQLSRLGFYSNSVKVPIQEELAEKLGDLSGYPDYQLFLCNSGAEATENAVKAASFNNHRAKIIAFDKAFHGRTSMAVQCTDNAKILTPFDRKDQVVRLPLNDFDAFDQVMDESIGAVIVEGILGIGGIYEPAADFLHHLRKRCDEKGAYLILDEVQSGYGRSGRFFAHQYSGVKPDIITVAKGMGNGFPVGGVLIAPHLTSFKGMLGSTFGGNHLACAAGLAVLEVMEKEKLVQNAEAQGQRIMSAVKELPGVKEVRGKGLMIGVEMEYEIAQLRHDLLFKHYIFTGSASNPFTLRLLPSLGISDVEVDHFLEIFEPVVKSAPVSA